MWISVYVGVGARVSQWVHVVKRKQVRNHFKVLFSCLMTFKVRFKVKLRIGSGFGEA